MRHAVFFSLFTSSASNNNAVGNAVDALIAQNAQRVAIKPVKRVIWHKGRRIVHGLIACPTAADADALHASIRNVWVSGINANRVLAESWSRRVDSFADEGLSDVTTSEVRK